MNEDSPTDNGGQDAGSQQDLPANDQNQSAEDRQADTGSDESQSQSQGEPAKQPTQTDDSSQADDAFIRFAKSQGVEDPNSLSEKERKFLELAHQNVKEKRKDMQSSADELRKAASEVHNPDAAAEGEEDDYLKELRRNNAEVAQLRAENRVTNFYLRNPEAREYDKEMGQLVVEETKQNGPEAGRYLAANLDRLLTLAKAQRGTGSADKVAEDARRQEREELRHRTEGSADHGNARHQSTSSGKVTPQWLANEYDPSNPEHVKMVDGALSRGEL